MMDEFELIERFFTTRGAPGDGVWLGIGDDAAVLEVPPGCTVIDEMTIHPIPEGGGRLRLRLPSRSAMPSSVRAAWEGRRAG